MNSLQYWDSRWSADGSFNASWPDTFARMLELEFIRDAIGSQERFVLELGCGPLSLDENFYLATYLRTHWFYIGIDGSAAAARIARARHPGAQIIVADLEDPNFEWPAADLLICRRTLQNISHLVRPGIMERLSNYPNGILIEGTCSGLTSLNDLREGSGLPGLVEPPFNRYLTAPEEAIILNLPGARKVSFLDKYYEQTRGVRQLEGWNTAEHLEAYEAQRRAPKKEHGRGPVQGFIWRDSLPT